MDSATIFLISLLQCIVSSFDKKKLRFVKTDLLIQKSLCRLVRLAFKRTLTESDVFNLEPPHRVSAAIKSFDKEWSAEKAKNKARQVSYVGSLSL